MPNHELAERLIETAKRYESGQQRSATTEDILLEAAAALRDNDVKLTAKDTEILELKDLCVTFGVRRLEDDERIATLTARVQELEQKHIKLFNADVTIEMLEEGLEARRELTAYETLPDDLEELQKMTEAWEPHVTRRNIASMKICIMLSRTREQLTAIKMLCESDREDMGVEGFQKEILELLKEQA